MAATACPHCATALVPGARFCPACGQATVPTATAGGGGTLATSAGDPNLGREIGGRYRIVAKLGEGGMGAVYRGEQISLKRTVAVKLLRPEMSSNEMLLRRFNAEAEAVAKLNHPNTVNIYDFGRDSDGSLFIAMEFIEGRSLRRVIHEQGPLHPTRALAIAGQVAASLADAHAHAIVHRDLKPDNVMLQDRGRQRDVVRVLDFGIAKLRDDTRGTQAAMTQAGDMLGTPQYMAPEQIRGDAIDGRTDIYALGCMLYEMVTGRMPFEAPSVMAMLSKHLLEHAQPPSVRRPDLGLPPAVDHLIMAAMAKDVAARPPTMELFGEHITALAASLPPDPRAPAAAPSVARSAMQQVPTPAAYSAVAPGTASPGPPAPTPGPAGYAAAPSFTPAPPAYAPPPYATPPHAQQVAPRRSRAALYAILTVLLLGGAGTGIYFATQRGSAKSSDGSDGSAVVIEPKHDDFDDIDDDEPKPPAPDEYVERSPKGFGLIVPPGYLHVVSNDGTVTATGADNGAAVMIMVGETPGADLNMIANAARSQGMEATVGTFPAKGKSRPFVRLAGVFNGEASVQILMVFDDQNPAVLAWVQTTAANADAGFNLFAARVFERRVILP
jgi:tRNA A-37 threonylcarbamoyl transferase component Bud32